jgi:hypothetical protein
MPNQQINDKLYFIKRHNITDSDMISIKRHEKSIDDIIENYNLIINASTKGGNFVNLEKPLVDDNIIILSEKELVRLETRYNKENDVTWPAKFIPASGSASRMFGYLNNFFHEPSKLNKNYSKVIETIKGLDNRGPGPQFAFIDQLDEALKKDNYNLHELIDDSLKGNNSSINLLIDYVLFEKGLNFITLPKALIPFHTRNGETIIALHNHMEEVSKNKNAKLNITILPYHEKLFLETINAIKVKFPHLAKVEVNISFQKPTTDTIALDPKTKEIIRDANREIVFFPAGHGSLIYNIHETSFIKTIDNFPYSNDAQEELRKYHKAMLILLKDIKKIICDTLNAIEDSTITLNELEKNLTILFENKVDIFMSREEYIEADFNLKKQIIKETLNRPLCIIGLVRNEGEPGGGPFFYKMEDKLITSIIEKDEISEKQKILMKNGKFFNPVDILFDPVDCKGNLFSDLLHFEDSDRYFLVKKTYKGKDILRIEHPGLWNGRMAKYNKIWFSLPINTFAPVKELIDLLNNTHQGKETK